MSSCRGRTGCFGFLGGMAVYHEYCIRQLKQVGREKGNEVKKKRRKSFCYSKTFKMSRSKRWAKWIQQTSRAECDSLEYTKNFEQGF